MKSATEPTTPLGELVSSNREPPWWWWRNPIRLLVGTLVLGTLVALGSISASIYQYLSSWPEYSELKIGMSRKQARQTLSSAGIACSLSYDSNATLCTFSDFWRDYVVELDPLTSKVVRKALFFRRHGFIDKRVANLLRVPAK